MSDGENEDIRAGSSLGLESVASPLASKRVGLGNRGKVNNGFPGETLDRKADSPIPDKVCMPSIVVQLLGSNFHRPPASSESF